MLGKQITAEELHVLIESGLSTDSVVIDVRTKEECARGMIAGAKNIPVDEIMERKAELLPYKKVYLYCLSGSRSELASASLGASNIPVELYSLTSGILAWRKGGYPLV